MFDNFCAIRNTYETHIFMPSHRFSSLAMCFFGGKRERHSKTAGRMGKILSDWHHMIPRLIHDFRDSQDPASVEMSHQSFTKLGRCSSIPRVFLAPEMAGFSEASGWTSG